MRNYYCKDGRFNKESCFPSNSQSQITKGDSPTFVRHCVLFPYKQPKSNHKNRFPLRISTVSGAVSLQTAKDESHNMPLPPTTRPGVLFPYKQPKLNSGNQLPVLSLRSNTSAISFNSLATYRSPHRHAPFVAIPTGAFISHPWLWQPFSMRWTMRLSAALSHTGAGTRSPFPMSMSLSFMIPFYPAR